jgi:hypothetical protein
VQLTRRLYFALFGLTALVAAGSFWAQLPGLVGPRGIAPAGEYVEALRRAPGVSALDVPTLAWLSSGEWLLHALCGVGVASALALLLGLAPRLASLSLWASWLSLVQVCHPFLDFQWDLLLVETAFFSALYAPGGLRARWDDAVSPAPAFLMVWLACKVTLESGVVKLASGDPAWRDLTALTWHWWTQPLPTWSSVLLAQLPVVAQQAVCALTLVLELPVPVLALGPRPARRIAALALMALQLGLFAAGNYSFYNLLAFTLAVPLLDDALLRRLLPGWLTLPHDAPPLKMSRAGRLLVIAVVLLGVGQFFRRSLETTPVGPLLALTARFETVNAYGAFAWMTKSRPEIILEGSEDGVSWRPYELPFKPGALDRRPDFIAPWQPRLDWQWWFAALGTCGDNPWVLNLQRRVLDGAPEVLALFAVNPFPVKPPRLLRTRVFEYRFAPWEARGVWWTRTETGPYCPVVMLGDGGRLIRAP